MGDSKRATMTGLATGGPRSKATASGASCGVAAMLLKLTLFMALSRGILAAATSIRSWFTLAFKLTHSALEMLASPWGFRLEQALAQAIICFWVMPQGWAHTSAKPGVLDARKRMAKKILNKVRFMAPAIGLKRMAVKQVDQASLAGAKTIG